jgi:hypothetical protein
MQTNIVISTTTSTIIATSAASTTHTTMMETTDGTKGSLIYLIETWLQDGRSFNDYQNLVHNQVGIYSIERNHVLLSILVLILEIGIPSVVLIVIAMIGCVWFVRLQRLKKTKANDWLNLHRQMDKVRNKRLYESKSATDHYTGQDNNKKCDLVFNKVYLFYLPSFVLPFSSLGHKISYIN